MSPESPPMLKIAGLRHRFGPVVAVDDVELEIAPGEIVCLVGPSGCGKTTLLRLVAGLEDVQSGRIEIAGDVVAEAAKGLNMPPDRRGVGMVFQDFALFPHLTVLENASFGLRDLASPERRSRALKVLEQVGMAGQAGLHPHTLSGGQQQRVALARALAPEPRLMLLDEPFSGLDARLRDQVRDDTLHILKGSGAATLLVTHDGEEAMFLADRIAVMQEGAIVQIGRPRDIYCAPSSAFVASFFSDVNRLQGHVRRGEVETPFGPIPATTLAEGGEVEILIRPEALRIADAGAGIPTDALEADCAGRVITSRLLGRSSLIHLCIGDFEGNHVHVHARVPGQVLPAEDDVVGVDLDLRQTFVFPRIQSK